MSYFGGEPHLSSVGTWTQRLVSQQSQHILERQSHISLYSCWALCKIQKLMDCLSVVWLFFLRKREGNVRIISVCHESKVSSFWWGFESCDHLFDECNHSCPVHARWGVSYNHDIARSFLWYCNIIKRTKKNKKKQLWANCDFAVFRSEEANSLAAYGK